MDAIEGENHHHHEVGNQQRGVKKVPVIQVLEGLVGVMRPEVVLQPVLGKSKQQAPPQVEKTGKRIVA
jgi:hypothetical protein